MKLGSSPCRPREGSHITLDCRFRRARARITSACCGRSPVLSKLEVAALIALRSCRVLGSSLCGPRRDQCMRRSQGATHQCFLVRSMLAVIECTLFVMRVVRSMCAKTTGLDLKAQVNLTLHFIKLRKYGVLIGQCIPERLPSEMPRPSQEPHFLCSSAQ